MTQKLAPAPTLQVTVLSTLRVTANSSVMLPPCRPVRRSWGTTRCALDPRRVGPCTIHIADGARPAPGCERDGWKLPGWASISDESPQTRTIFTSPSLSLCSLLVCYGEWSHWTQKRISRCSIQLKRALHGERFGSHRGTRPLRVPQGCHPSQGPRCPHAPATGVGTGQPPRLDVTV